MQQQGYNDSQIIEQLREEGNSPTDINNAINQASIKNEVDKNRGQEQAQPQGPQDAQGGQMEESIADQGQSGQQENPGQQQSPQPPEPEQEPQYEGQQQYAEGDYAANQGGGYDNYGGGYAEGTVGEDIAEEIVAEKLNPINKEIANLKNREIHSSKKLKNIDKRLKKIEDTIEELKSNIINRVGSYGEAIQDIKGDMGMMQDSFSKALNPLIEEGKKKSTQQRKTRKSNKGKKK